MSKSNLKEVTLEALFNKIQDIEDNKPDILKYSKASPKSFPRFPIKFKSDLWSWKVARAQMGIVMKVLGFKRGNATEKSYTFPDHQPQGWPEAVRFKKPKFATKNEANMVIESILMHHGIDPYRHHVFGADGGIAVHSRETVDSSDSDDEEPVNDASNNNGIAVEDRVDAEQAANALNNNSIVSEEGMTEEEIMKLIEEGDKKESEEEETDEEEGDKKESEDEETDEEEGETKESEDEDGNDDGSDDLSPYERIREENIRKRKEEEQEMLKDLSAAKKDLQSPKKPKPAVKRKLPALGPSTMSLRSRKK